MWKGASRIWRCPWPEKSSKSQKGPKKMLRVTSSVSMEIGECLSLPSDNNNRNKRMAGKREGRSGRRGQETSPGSSIDPGDSGQGPGDQLSPVGAPSHGQVLCAGTGFLLLTGPGEDVQPLHWPFLETGSSRVCCWSRSPSVGPAPLLCWLCALHGPGQGSWLQKVLPHLSTH